MKIITFCHLLVCCTFFACSSSSNNETKLKEEIVGLKEHIKQLEASQHVSQGLEPGKIKHTVMFNLKHKSDAPETEKFLRDAQQILTAIPGVENFQVFRQVSSKNEFHYCFSMVFAGSTAYQAYNNHPDHVKFVKERWDTEVSKFLEGDFEKF